MKPSIFSSISFIFGTDSPGLEFIVFDLKTLSPRLILLNSTMRMFRALQPLRAPGYQDSIIHVGHTKDPDHHMYQFALDD